MMSNDRVGVSFSQPRNDAERSAVAGKCGKALEMTFPLLVDGVDDRVGHLYSGIPDRLYVVGADGRVVYKSGRGPFGFNPREMEQTMAMHLLAVAPSGSRPAASARGERRR